MSRKTINCQADFFFTNGTVTGNHESQVAVVPKHEGTHTEPKPDLLEPVIVYF